MYGSEYTPPPSPTPSLPDSNISSLERDFCSNFSCCGLALADLHELVDHFEEYHVVVLARDGRPIYPAPVTDLPSSSFGSVYATPPVHDACTSLVLSYPQPHPPVPPPPLDARLDPAFHLAQAARTFRDVADIAADMDATDADADGASSASSSSARGSALSSPLPSAPTCLPPALLSASHAHAPPRHAHAPKARMHAAAPPPGLAARSEPRRADARFTPVKRREKAYKCPRPGCLKSYLNPNGLKYHLEKGTCTTPAPCAAPAV